MSRLEELIAELCPNGVEYKQIGEIATDIFRGSGIKREDVTAEGIPCVRYGEIYTTYGVWFDTCISHTVLDKVQTPKAFGHGDILFAITGESIEEIAKCTAYVGHKKCLAGGDIVVLKHKEDPKYLSYALSTTDAIKQKSKGKVKSKVVHQRAYRIHINTENVIPKYYFYYMKSAFLPYIQKTMFQGSVASIRRPMLLSFPVPVPSIEEQERIVSILDRFDAICSDISSGIPAEIEARQKQYEYYRDKLLTFKELSA